METTKLYSDISTRTNGDIYIGVVGPVRTGKSTFIKQFMETLVVPNINGDFQKQRAVDELPQSAAGRTIMTAEPKFIPDEAVRIELTDGAAFRVKMIDCVGYIVPSALGYIENDMPRMVQTPWFPDPIPFNLAAEIGTKKVITDHSTIGIVLTSDGSFGDLERQEFVEAEERIIRELKEIDKPFVVIVNTTDPSSASARNLVDILHQNFDVPALACNCTELDESDIRRILECVLFEFPIKELNVSLPEWVISLPNDEPLKSSVLESLVRAPLSQGKLRNLSEYIETVKSNEYAENCQLINSDLGRGASNIRVDIARRYFFNILSSHAQIDIPNDGVLMKTVIDLCQMKNKYVQYAEAIEQARGCGYGVVMPNKDELILEEPELIKQEGRYGVRLRASAPSLHMIQANIQTQIMPVIGTENQSEEFSSQLLQQFKDAPADVWDTDIFGRSLYDMVNDGLRSKLYNMPDEARNKYKETLERIINEGSDGLICIIL